MATPEKPQFFKPEELERLRGQVDNDRYQELIKLSEYATVNRNLNNLEQVVEKSLDEKIAFLKGLEQEQKQEQTPKITPAVIATTAGIGTAAAVGNKINIFDKISTKWDELTTGFENKIDKLWDDIKDFFSNIIEKLLGGILGGTALGKWLGIGEKIKELISPEQQKEVKDKIKSELYKLFPDNKGHIDQQVETLSVEKLTELYQKHKNGTLNIQSIQNSLPELEKELLTGVNFEEYKEGFLAKMTESLQKGIEDKYYGGQKLPNDKVVELKNLITQSQTLNKGYYTKMKEIEMKKEISVTDLSYFGKELAIDTGSIIWGLMIKGIVPASAIALNFVEGGIDIIKMGVSSLGFETSMKFEDFEKKLENLSDTEKRVAIGLLYRKGGLFLNAVGSMSAYLQEMTLIFVTSSNFDFIPASKDLIFKNFDKLGLRFESLSKILGVPAESNELFKRTAEAVKNIGANYMALSIINEGGDIKFAIDEIRKLPGFGAIESSITGFDELGRKCADIARGNFGKSLDMISQSKSQAVKRLVGFGLDSTIYDLNKSLQRVFETQNELFTKRQLFGVINKLKSVLASKEIAKLGDRSALFFKTPQEALKYFSELNTEVEKVVGPIGKTNAIAKESSVLLKGLFNMLPYVFVAGVSANDEEGFFKGLAKNTPYVFNLIGPILLMGEGALNWEKFPPTIVKPVEFGIGAAFFGYDIVKVGKLIGSKKPGEAVRYVFKPVGDFLKVARGTANIANIGWHAYISGGVSGVAKEAGKGAEILSKNARALISRIKTIAKSPAAIAVALAIVGIYIGYKYFSKDEKEQISKFTDENGGLDMEKLRKHVIDEKLGDDEKEAILKAIYPDYEDNIRVVSNKLNVTSENLEIPGELLEALALI